MDVQAAFDAGQEVRTRLIVEMAQIRAEIQELEGIKKGIRPLQDATQTIEPGGRTALEQSAYEPLNHTDSWPEDLP